MIYNEKIVIPYKLSKLQASRIEKYIKLQLSLPAADFVKGGHKQRLVMEAGWRDRGGLVKLEQKYKGINRWIENTILAHRAAAISPLSPPKAPHTMDGALEILGAIAASQALPARDRVSACARIIETHLAIERLKNASSEGEEDGVDHARLKALLGLDDQDQDQTPSQDRDQLPQESQDQKEDHDQISEGDDHE